jgi:hypothetical protein
MEEERRECAAFVDEPMILGLAPSAICLSRAVVWIGIYSKFRTLGLISFAVLGRVFDAGFVWMQGSE